MERYGPDAHESVVEEGEEFFNSLMTEAHNMREAGEMDHRIPRQLRATLISNASSILEGDDYGREDYRD